MIHNMKVENLYSIGQEQEFDFTCAKMIDNSVAETKFGYINKINCIIGNNGAGKTNFLKAVTFFRWLAEESFYKSKGDELIPFEPHYLNSNKLTTMQMTFDKNDKLFKLEFELNKKYILSEKLSIKKNGDIKFKKVYSVSRKDNKLLTLYSEYLKPLNKNERDRFKSKNNCSLFSYLIMTGALTHLGLNSIFTSFYSNLSEAGMVDIPILYDCFRISEMLKETKKYKDVILKTLKTFDIGINDISENSNGQFVVHDAKTDKVIMDKEVISLVHGTDKQKFEVPLPFESSGTIRSLSLLFPIIDVLNNGGLLVVDEIEKSKHPIIIKKLISSFEYLIKDNNDVQIIFSTHQPLLLDNRNKSQIFLAEKTDYINTEIYRLDDVEGVRNDENFAMKYLSGRYGATPRGEVKID